MWAGRARNLKQFVIQDGTYQGPDGGSNTVSVKTAGCSIRRHPGKQGAVDLASSTVSDLTDLTALANAGIPVISLAFNGQNTVPKNSGRIYLFWGRTDFKGMTRRTLSRPKSLPAAGGGGGVNRPAAESAAAARKLYARGIACPNCWTNGRTREKAIGRISGKNWIPSGADREAAELVDKGIFQGKGDRLDLYGTVTRRGVCRGAGQAMEWGAERLSGWNFPGCAKGRLVCGCDPDRQKNGGLFRAALMGSFTPTIL